MKSIFLSFFLVFTSSSGSANGENSYHLVWIKNSTCAYKSIKNVGKNKYCKMKHAGMNVRIDNNAWHDKVWKKRKWIKEAPSEYSKPPYYWYRVSDLGEDLDFNKFNGAWPVKYLFFGEGDYSVEIKFSRNGQAKFYDMVDNKKYVGHVFILGNLIMVKYPTPSYNSILFVAPYDKDTKKIKMFVDEENIEQRLFKEKK